MPALYLPSFTSLNSAIASIFGNNIRIVHASPAAYGGDINKPSLTEIDEWPRAFWRRRTGRTSYHFTAEAAVIRLIVHTGGDRDAGAALLWDRRGSGWIFFFWLWNGSRERGWSSHYWETFANQLALPCTGITQDFITGGRYGFHQNNYIGASPRRIAAYDSWGDIFRDCRLEHRSDLRRIILGRGT